VLETGVEFGVYVHEPDSGLEEQDPEHEKKKDFPALHDVVLLQPPHPQHDVTPQAVEQLPLEPEQVGGDGVEQPHPDGEGALQP